MDQILKWEKILKVFYEFKYFFTFTLLLLLLLLLFCPLQPNLLLLSVVIKDYNDEDFHKVIQFFSYKLLKSLHKAVISRIEKEISVIFLEILFINPFTTSSARFIRFDARNVSQFQIKIFGRNINETTLIRYFIKVTVRPSFTLLRVIVRVH